MCCVPFCQALSIVEKTALDESQHDVLMPPSTISKLIYPKSEAEAKMAAFEQTGPKPMGAPRKVRLVLRRSSRDLLSVSCVSWR